MTPPPMISLTMDTAKTTRLIIRPLIPAIPRDLSPNAPKMAPKAAIPRAIQFSQPRNGINPMIIKIDAKMPCRMEIKFIFRLDEIRRRMCEK